jgi:hypothetical protein
MEKSKLKMKYLLGIWKDLPEYPTKEDVIYELNSYLIKDGRPDGEFSDQTFNSFLPENWEDEKFRDIVKELIETEIFENTYKTLGNQNWDKIKHNPHY